MTAAERWASGLASWALPEKLLAQAEDDPWALPVELFARHARDTVAVETPTHVRAREALPRGGSVLDVGCGGGSTSLVLVPHAGTITGVDENAAMLDAFRAAVTERGGACETILGRWPGVARDAPVADVVVCGHVFYNVADLVPFVRELTAHARRRVVVEMTSTHPRAYLNPYFELVHGLTRPSRPTSEDAIEVLAEMGIEPGVERTPSEMRLLKYPDLLADYVRRALCLPRSRTGEVEQMLERMPPSHDRDNVTLWWDVS